MKLLNKLPVLVLLLIFSSCLDEIEPPYEGCTNHNSFNFDANAQSDNGSCKSMNGCLGYAPNFSNSGIKSLTLNDPFWDLKMSEEVDIQRNFFQGVPANVFILYEPDVSLKNAFATPEGEILFGYYMFYHTIAFFGALPVAGILAHEWGHRTQFHFNWSYKKVAHQELEADAFSGFYMALAKQYDWANIQSYFDKVYTSGEYNFNSPTHHGTPEQRVQAAYLGVETAISVLNSGIPYSYLDLHNLFSYEIETRIDAKTTMKFTEIVYPRNLSKEYIESLFPF